VIPSVLIDDEGAMMVGARTHDMPAGEPGRKPSQLRRWLLVLILAVLIANIVTGCAGRSIPTHSDTKPHRVAIVLTNHGQLGSTGRPTGFYLSEASHAYKIFHEAGYHIDFVSPKGGVAPMDGLEQNDQINAAFLADESLVARTRSTLPITSLDPSSFDAVFFAGGHGTMWDLPNDPQVQQFTRIIYEQGGIVAAVCHGPVGLVNVRLSNGEFLVSGKDVSAFTNEEESAVKLEKVVPFALESMLRERGARFVEAPNFEPMVAISERLVTGQNPASSIGVAEAVVRLLNQGSR
jgi:putative intracellular protease/amidase